MNEVFHSNTAVLWPATWDSIMGIILKIVRNFSLWLWFRSTAWAAVSKRILHNCDALRDLVPFAKFKKREKHPWRSVKTLYPHLILRLRWKKILLKKKCVYSITWISKMAEGTILYRSMSCLLHINFSVNTLLSHHPSQKFF